MVSLSIGLKRGLLIHMRARIGVFSRYELRMLKSRKVDTSDMRRGGDGLLAAMLKAYFQKGAGTFVMSWIDRRGLIAKPDIFKVLKVRVTKLISIYNWDSSHHQLVRIQALSPLKNPVISTQRSDAVSSSCV